MDVSMMTLAGPGVPVYSFNALFMLATGVLGVWVMSLGLRWYGLWYERKMISLDRAVVIDDASDHPEWMERAYVTRLANRQAREIPAVPIETLHLPFVLLNMEGEAADVYAPKASASVLSTSNGEYCFCFGVERSFWSALKEEVHNDFPHRFDPLQHAVTATGWRSFKGSPEPQHLESGTVEPGNTHYPTSGDVSVVLVLRGSDWGAAFSGASDLRLLETLVFTPMGEMLEVRDTFAETEDEDCLVCCAEPKNVILLPCRHACCCRTCLARMDKCPVCRAPVESFVSFGHEESHVVAARPEEQPDLDMLQDIELGPM